MSYDRCDTDPFWFIFADKNKPYFACRANIPGLNPLIREVRRRGARRGAFMELRSGNYAAATLDELRSAWPKGSEALVSENWLYIAPTDYVQEDIIQEEVAA